MDNAQTPIARDERIVVQELADELLVYDLNTDKAHCLNQTAAFVWKACNGTNTIAEIVSSLEMQTGSQVPENLVWLAIDQLNERKLLRENMSKKFSGESRRLVLKKIGLASVVALPVIYSLIAPTAALAVACSGTVNNCVGCPDGTPCDVDMDTVIGMCVAGFCAGDLHFNVEIMTSAVTKTK
jgi:hypothetical protein